MNRYDVDTQALLDLHAECEASSVMQEQEKVMMHIKQQLLNTLPGFQKEEENFSWMAAADHFVCRKAYQTLSTWPGTEELHLQTLDHLSFRFQQVKCMMILLQLYHVNNDCSFIRMLRYSNELQVL